MPTRCIVFAREAYYILQILCQALEQIIEISGTDNKVREDVYE